MTEDSKKIAMKIFEEEMEKERSGDHDPSRFITFEVKQIHKNGLIVNSEITASFLRNSEGLPIGILGVTRNITKRKQIEAELIKYRKHLEEEVEKRTSELLQINDQLRREIEERKQITRALRESEEKFRQITENMLDSISVLDENGTIKYISPSQLRLLVLNQRK